uniref:Mitochondrial Rho GTPase n=2 Tax=Brassica oleracea var. oleracea TaxID=109376 RepID=A0A0D3E136_BRAOL
SFISSSSFVATPLLINSRVYLLPRGFQTSSVSLSISSSSLSFQMAAASPNNSVRIVVIGDKGTGKSSLIVAAATDSFPPNAPPVLPDTKLPFQFFPDGIPVTLVDTSSRPEDKGMVAEELKLADAVVLTYDCDRPETLEGLSLRWLPELRLLEVKVPIIVAGCKLDVRDDNSPVVLEEVMAPIMHQFREIETCIECSALKQLQAQEVFYYAQKTVIHPTAPLFDQETQTLKPRCVRALKRIFILCDHDKDGALSEAELNAFQVKCFHAPLQPSEVDGVKRVVQEKLPEGVNEVGLTLTGFLFLHALFIEKGRLETTWTVLRKFGYNNDIRLADELLPPSLFKRAPDQSVELPDVAIEFLKGKYMLFDADGDNNLRPQEIEDLFSTAPESPWKEAPYEDAAEKTALGGLSSDAFLSMWSLMTLLEPARSVEHLIYIGFQGDPSSAIRFTRKRLLDRKKKQCERKVVQCFVFGPSSAGKSALLNYFLGRSYADNTESTTDERYAVNVVDETKSAKKTLVMREIPADGAQGIFSSKESLAACDIAVFVYDSSDESSWKRASELLVEVANHGQATGYEVPCLMVSAKDDIVSSQISIQDSTRVTQEMGIEPPVSISSKLGDFNNLFCKIVTAAQHPHLSIPETEAGKSRKHYNRLINRSLLSVSIGAAAVVVGLAAYRVYAARKSASA